MPHPSTVILAREQLDNLKCDDPNCKSDHTAPLFQVAACHPRQGLEVFYVPGSGVLDVQCHVCGRPVARIAVAP